MKIKTLSIICVLLLAMLVAIVYSVDVITSTITTTDVWVYVETANEYGNSSMEEIATHETNYSIDGNWTTYTLANGTLYRNYTKLGDNYDSLSSTLWQVKYNATGGTTTTTNHSIPTVCWAHDNTKLIFKVNLTRNGTDGSNAHYCFNGSWTRIGDVQTEAAFFEDALFLDISGRDVNVTVGLISPVGTTKSAYFPTENTAVNFNFTYTDTLADENHTTLNATLWTRITNTGAFTANVTDMIVNNGSYTNVTVNFNDGDTVWWYLSFEDNYSRSIVDETPTRIIEVDIDYEIFCMGPNCEFNFSILTGDYVIAGDFIADSVTATDYNLINTTVSGACSASNNGLLTYNATDHRLLFCNSTAWNVIVG